MLEALPNSIGNLSNLKTLRLDYCKNLKELPMAFGNLQSLNYLRAEGTSFFCLPNSFSNLLNLEVLHLNYCMNLHDLPPSISGLVKLRELYVGENKVEKLPEDIGQLESLKVLNLAGCKHLKTLPESFGRLKALNHLNISGCSFGEGIGLPSNVGDLPNLKSLFLDGNLMSTIPESFKALSALQWQDSPMLELPKNFNLFNLVELNLGHSKILKCLWECNLHTQVRNN